MRYYHQSHRRCGKPFDPNELPNPKAPLKSEYFARDPCPKCGQPFEQPRPPSSMLVWVHCENCDKDYYTDVRFSEDDWVQCPLCDKEAPYQQGVGLIIPPAPVAKPTLPTQPPLALRSLNMTPATTKKEQLTFKDLLKYIGVAALGLVIAVLMLGWLVIALLLLPCLICMILVIALEPPKAKKDSQQQDGSPATPQNVTSGNEHRENQGVAMPNTDNAVERRLNRGRSILTDKRLLFLIGIGVGILFCYLLSRVLEETRQTLRQLVETGTLSVALFGVVVYAALYFITLNKKFASSHVLVQGLILSGVVGITTTLTLIFIPALLGQPLSEDSVSINVIINVIGSVLTTLYVIVCTNYWQKTIVR